ncbi:hypothetical protein [Mucilaginibacter antarcticus]|uniref:hypothetical protein n=1 Tax=Mucilaginibacter antarcticus TaxID=1855725 RepID=UPI0036369031
METTTKTHLCISIFYSKKKWNELICECLSPFLKRNADVIYSYSITFSTAGENIQVLINCFNGFICQRELDNALSLYLKDNPSVLEDNAPEKDSLFVNFPNNKHLYGLFKPPRLKHGDSNELINHNFQVLISKSIVSKLSQSPINQERILIFGIYIQCVVFKVIFDKNKLIANNIKEITNTFMQTLPIDAQVSVELRCLFVQRTHAGELNILFNQMWLNSAVTTDFKWLHDLSRELRDLLATTEKTNELSVTLLKLLFEQLDLRSNHYIALSSNLNYHLVLLMLYVKKML